VNSFFPAQIRPDHQMEDVSRAVQHAQAVARDQPPLAVPLPNAAEQPWESFTAGWAAMQTARLHGEQRNRATVLLSSMFGRYRTYRTPGSDAAEAVTAFNLDLAHYQDLLATNPPAQFNASKISVEAWFNHSGLFFWCVLLYLFAFILAALAWLGWSGPLNRAAFWLIAFTLVVHTGALVARIYISGRPPVTNLYSSAVFIGWGCVVLSLIIELIYRLGVGNIVAAAAGFATLLVAFFLSRQGDTFVVLQAVLDTQFWLATHVTCITLGYSTTFLAGCFGIVYILRGVATPSLSPQVGKELSRMIYGTICFAIFFSFVGTVLGGLWADDSWGRFWGWDPKENGALIIVLWCALVLHARSGGMVKDRGLAVLAVAGNICTAWSWFGVNELGVGLHSYGFTEGVLLALGLFFISQVAVIALGLLPTRLWWSFREPSSASG
jgi:ABC-type transport system involved in cytochrome c biogenesis permease subunit